MPNLCCNPWTTGYCEIWAILFCICIHDVIFSLIKKLASFRTIARKILREAAAEKGHLSKMISTNLWARCSNLKSLYKLKPNFNTPTLVSALVGNLFLINTEIFCLS